MYSICHGALTVRRREISTVDAREAVWAFASGAIVGVLVASVLARLWKALFAHSTAIGFINDFSVSKREACALTKTALLQGVQRLHRSFAVFGPSL